MVSTSTTANETNQTFVSRAAGHIGRNTINYSPIVIAILLWEFLVHIDVLDGFLTPAPSTVIVTGFRLLGLEARSPGPLFGHIGASLFRLASGVAIASVLGTAVGFVMGMSRFGYKAFYPIIAVVMPVPSLAWAPILILVLGLDNRTTITVVALAASFSIVYNTMVGAKSIKQAQKWALLSMGGGRRDMLFRVLVPGALAYTITGLRLAVGYGWRALIAAEMLAATSRGLGFMIFDAREYMATSTIYVGVVVIGALGIIVERLMFKPLEKRTTERWGITAIAK